MKKHYILLSIASILCIVFNSCKKENGVFSLESSTDYFNYSTGNVMIYTGDSTLYDDFSNSKTTIHFNLKDSITQVEEIGKKTIYHIERSIQYKDSSYFRFLYEYKLEDESGINRIIFNVREFLLPEMFSINNTWNGNKYNNGEEREYYIQQITEREVIIPVKIKTVDVVQLEERNLIRQDIRSEMYAKGIGIISQTQIGINTDIGTGDTTSGYVLNIRVKEFRP